LPHPHEEANMAPDERSRVEASQALTEQLGPAAAAALMECIPPFGWHEIATKRDLDELERRIDLRFDAIEAKFEAKLEKLEAKFEALQGNLVGMQGNLVGMQGQLEGRLHAEATRMIKWTVGAVCGVITAICVAVATVAALL
jgi:flagellar motility protein MotE (MotC chaperone)